MFRPAPRDVARPSPMRNGLIALALAVVVACSMAAAAIGAEPSPLLVDPLDPRAEGEGPGVVGAPLLAALAVIAVGLLAAGLTALYVRLVGRR